MYLQNKFVQKIWRKYVIHKILSFAHVSRARYLWGHIPIWQMVEGTRRDAFSAHYSTLVSVELPARRKLDRRRSQEADMFVETQRAFTFRSGDFHFKFIVHRPHKVLEQHISWEIALKYCKFSETAKVSVINNSFTEIKITLFCKLHFKS